MSRETGWYRVRCLRRINCGGWEFAELTDEGWMNCDGQHCDESDFDEIDETPVNPVPADETNSYYAVRFHYKNGEKIISTNRSNDPRKLAEIVKVSKARNTNLSNADIVHVTTEIREWR